LAYFSFIYCAFFLLERVARQAGGGAYIPYEFKWGSPDQGKYSSDRETISELIFSWQQYEFARYFFALQPKTGSVLQGVEQKNKRFQLRVFWIMSID